MTPHEEFIRDLRVLIAYYTERLPGVPIDRDSLILGGRKEKIYVKQIFDVTKANDLTALFSNHFADSYYAKKLIYDWAANDHFIGLMIVEPARLFGLFEDELLYVPLKKLIDEFKQNNRVRYDQLITCV